MHKIGTLVAGITLATTSLASAQVLSVGTTEGGAVAQLGAAISNVVSDHSGYQMRPQAMAGTQQYMTGVDLGRIDFGISNVMQYYMGHTGTMLSEGDPHENLRVVATIAPFIQGVIVTNESGITSVAELEGKRIPSGYSASPLFEYFWDAFLASEGLDRSMIEEVPVTSLPNSWEAFRQGDVDAVIAASGSAAVREMDATISGGVRYIPLQPDEDMLAALPKTRIEIVEPAEGLDGIPEPTGLHVYETVLFAHAGVPDDVVYAVVDALVQGEQALMDSGPLWSEYSTAMIAMDHGLDYHPGAARYYDEHNLWSE
ncbi:TAXI family TRAP transporter solute-binding subunit [Alkalilacustris brevis]|uniref:TAXI family TRAP transporter solute-binding subunit n=1 Tax=Alkalilacustris brevis TaxID=2026338 RepID=UPI000E0CC19B|nr:TAXI family TRAP transporter solute-binding subunit [Alkalilacustris brevis]